MSKEGLRSTVKMLWDEVKDVDFEGKKHRLTRIYKINKMIKGNELEEVN